MNACTYHDTGSGISTKEGDFAASGNIDKGPDRYHDLHMFKRRLGPNPHAGGARSAGLRGCPDVFELDSGDFAIIGRDITGDAIGRLPADASCGPDERVILIPRRTLVGAKSDIPEKV